MFICILIPSGQTPVAGDDHEDSDDLDDGGPYMPGHFDGSPTTSIPAPGGLPLFGRGASVFRVGFAGRGMNFGRGRGQ